MRDYMDPVIDAAREKHPDPRTRPLLIWCGTHRQGDNKPEAFLALQGNPRVLEFNKATAAHARARSGEAWNNAGDRVAGGSKHTQDDVFYFDTFGLTDGQPSYDGTHYGQRVNVAKAQVLLNFLERVVISRGVSEALLALHR
jgi:hypothetical protein